MKKTLKTTSLLLAAVCFLAFLSGCHGDVPTVGTSVALGDTVGLSVARVRIPDIALLGDTGGRIGSFESETAAYTSSAQQSALAGILYPQVPTVSSKNASSVTASVRKAAVTAKTSYTRSEILAMTIEQVKAVNADFFGFIHIPGADNINEPVMLTNDESTYHRYDFNHVYDRYGTIYVAAGTSWTSLDKNTIVYGHNRGKSAYNSHKFGPLVKYRTPGYAQKYPYIYLDTVHGSYKFQIFTVMVCNASVSGISNYMCRDFGSDDYAARLFQYMKNASIYDTGVQVSGSDHIITLITCVYDFDEARLVIMGKLVS